MITIEEYINKYNEEKEFMLKSESFKSSPKFLFKPDGYALEDYVFNSDNWNGCDILRRFLYNHFDDITKVGSFEIKYYIHNDQTTIFILDSINFYEISWYKNRGRTDYIKKNGDLICLGEYVDLCNKLYITI